MSEIDMQRDIDMQRNRGMQDSYGMQGGHGGSTRTMYQGGMGDMRYGQGHQGMGHTQGQGFGESGGQYGMNQQRGLGHRGKGPQGWQRSDDRIKEMVCEMLHDDDDIDASRIQVDVKNCEVTLTGAVPDRHMKRAAEDLVDADQPIMVYNVQLELWGQSTDNRVRELDSLIATIEQHLANEPGSFNNDPLTAWRLPDNAGNRIILVGDFNMYVQSSTADIPARKASCSGM